MRPVRKRKGVVPAAEKAAKRRKTRATPRSASARSVLISEELAALGIRLSPLQAAAVAPLTQRNYYTVLVALLAWLLVPRFP